MRTRAWLLGLHAFVVGIGFLAIGLPLVLLLADDALIDAAVRRHQLGELPRAVALGAVVVGGYYALPLLWPLHLAIGLHEANLVGGVRRETARAQASAARALLLQAALFALLALGVAVLTRGWAAAVAPVSVAALHVVLARWIGNARRPENRAGHLGRSGP